MAAFRLLTDEISEAEVLRLDAWFDAWADARQTPPSGEEWRTWLMMANHGPGETFTLIDSGRLTTLAIPSGAVGGFMSATLQRIADGLSECIGTIYHGEGLRPPSPVHVYTSFATDGSLNVAWTSRSRLAWGWKDGPEPCFGEARMFFRVSINDEVNLIEQDTGERSLNIPAADLVGFEGRSAILSVRAIGDLAQSHANMIAINF